MDFYRHTHSAQAARGGTVNVAELADLQSREADNSTAAQSDSRASNAERLEILRRALAILRPRFEKQTWSAFWRTSVDGCSPDDVAEELGVSRWSVYKARSRVLHRLRAELDGLEEL